jgi:hypothetical protein
MDYDNPWTYNGTHVTDADSIGLVGFVYLIENLETGRKYIGKKRFFFTKTRTVKKKKKREKVPSDWKEYYGSSKELQADIDVLGPAKFSRTILYMCTTLGECSYYEAYEQFVRGVLLTDDYYNGWISAKVSTSHLPKRK